MSCKTIGMRRSLMLGTAGVAWALASPLQAQSIQTYAGGGNFNQAGAGSVALVARASAVAPNGSVYVVSGNTVVDLNPANGTVTLVAGNGTPGYTGDGAAAASAQLDNPTGIGIDTAGDIYIADFDNQVIRRVDAVTGIITTVAGNGTQGYSGDSGAAVNAELSYPAAVAVDAAGDLYIADSSNNVIRFVNATSGIITTVAGNGTAGYSGNGGPATGAELSRPYGVAVDASGNLFVADFTNEVIREVAASSGLITTVAGSGTRGFGGDGGAATAALLNSPVTVAVDANDNLFIADTGNFRIREVVAASGLIFTVAGNGSAGFSGDGGPATAAQLSDDAAGVALDASDDLYVADEGNYRVRLVNAASGNIATIAGDGTAAFGGNGGAAPAAQLSTPFGAVADPSGDLLFADANNQVIWEIYAGTGVIVTVAGNGTPGYSGDGGLAGAAQLHTPHGVAVDTYGNVYIADTENHVIRFVNAASGVITTVVGNGTSGYSGDGGPATAAQLSLPYGIALDLNDNLYIADYENHVIREVSATTGLISTIAGDGTAGYSGNGGPAISAQLDAPAAVAVDQAGNVYIVDQGNNCVRAVKAASGDIAAFAGTQAPGYSGDGGPASSAQLSAPFGVTLDGGENVYIADFGNNRIRRVDASSAVITTVAGDGTFGFSGDGGAPTNAELAGPAGVAADYAGNLFVSDLYNNRIREITGVASVGPNYSLSPAALNFGNVPVNSSTTEVITLTNVGISTIKLASITLSGTNANLFTQTNSCGTQVAVGANCTISVVFKPAGAGAKKATLTINAGPGPETQEVALAGTAVTSTYTLQPTSLAFGNVALNTTNTLGVTVTNTGTVYLPVNAITLTGTNANQFSQTNNCGTAVAVGAACTINVAFDPTSAGSKSATLTFPAGGGAAKQSVALTGTGFNAATYTLLPTSVAFGNQALNTTSAAQVLTVTNTGSVALPINSVTLGGADPGQFTKTNNCGSSVAVGGNCTINVSFAPTISGSLSASVTVNAGAGAGAQTVSLTGTGFVVPTYTLAPTSAAFGAQTVNTSSAAQVLTVTNTGTVAVPINSISLSGSNPSQFAQINTCGGSVAVSGSCTISVTFAPTSSGAKSATLNLNAGNSAGKQTAALTGTGQALTRR
jgi:trimeric autotransporter adhesin